MELSEWREELAGVLCEHAWDTSDEQKIGGEWVWGLCCDCGEFVPGEEAKRHLADALLTSPAMARLLAGVRAEALREAADFIVDTSGIGKSIGKFGAGWYGALNYAVGELRAQAESATAHPTDDHAGEAK